MTLIDNGDDTATMELGIDRLTSGVFTPTISVSDGHLTISFQIFIDIVREDTIAPNVGSTISPPVPSGWHKTNATVTLTASDAGSGVQDITYSASGGQTIGLTTVDAETTQVVMSQEGTTTIAFTATDNLLNTSVVTTRVIKIDKQVPTVTTPTHTLLAGGQVAATTAPVTISWTGADVGPSGLKNVVLQQSIAGGALTTIAIPTPAATSITLDLTVDTLYQFRVRSVDRAGNASAFATGAAFSMVPRQESGGGIT